MPSDFLAYLDPSFDPSRLTKPQLRSILGEHGVTDLPAANAKKEVLLDLFERRVRQRANEIRRSKQGVRASVKGITFLDKQSQPSPKMSPENRPKIMSVVASSPRKSPVRRRDRSISPVKVTSPPTSTSADSIQSTVSTIKVKKPRGRSKAPKEDARSQSKSRTAAVSKPVGTPVRMLQDELPIRSDSPTSATIKLQRRLGFIASANNMSLAQEAITPVYADSPSKMKGLPSPPRLKKALVKLGYGLFALLKFIFALALTIFVAIYLRWKFVYPIPYCDTNSALKPFYPEVDVMTSLKNLCLPCPEHGDCSKGKLVCANGHIKQKRWLLLGEVCAIDWQRFSKAEDLLKNIKMLLRERQGAFQCRQCPTPTLGESALKAALTSSRFNRASWAGEDFESYYKLAILDVQKDPDHHGLTLMGDASAGQQRIFLSSIAKFSWRCQLYLLVSYFVDTYRWHLIGFSLAFLLIVYFYFRLRTARWERKKVDELVQTVLQCLAEQDALNRRDPSRPATLSVPQLRDALFMNASSKEKARLWPLVCSAIANNSNVRESVMSIKGEQHRVWEWIGMDVLAPFTKLMG